MTQQELRDEIWESLPPLRRRILGKERVEDLITMSMEHYPLELCPHILSGEGSEKVVLMTWEKNVKRSYSLVYGDDSKFGPLFWIMIGPIVQLILRKLLDYWFASRSHRVLLTIWRRQLTQ
jgi:hypothetical protein